MLDTIWHDPVGSAAIAGLIVLAVAGFASWFWQGLRAKGDAPTIPQMIVRILLVALPIAILLWVAEKLGEWSATHKGPNVLHTITSVGLPLLLGLIVALKVLQRSPGRPAAAPEVKPTAEPKVGAKVADVAAPAPDVADDPDSMEGYFSGVRALRGRFAERDEYLRRCRGKAVRWRGTVRSVRGYDSDNSVVVYLLGKSGQLTLTSVDFPATFRERVLALLPGDSVLVTGRLIKGDEDAVQIEGDGFELLRH